MPLALALVLIVRRRLDCGMGLALQEVPTKHVE
jgi:hypothetical protein